MSEVGGVAAGAVERIALTGTARAVREGMLAVVPAFLITALLWAIGGLLDVPAPGNSLSPVLRYPYLQLGGYLPELITGGVAFMVAVRTGLPRIATALMAVVHLGLALAIIDGHGVDPRAIAPLLAVALPLVTIRAMAALYGLRRLRVLRLPLAGNSTLEALNLVLPGVITGLAIAGVALCLTWLRLPEGFVAAMQAIPTDSSLVAGLGLALANSALWALGIHGYLSLRPSFDQLDVGVTQNAQDVLATGAADHIANGSFMGAFAFIGGSGATLSLAIAVLIFCRSSTLRMLAIASLPLALFNVNEVLLFGLPIVFNPRLWVPFVAAPAINVCVAYLATSTGVLPPVVEPLPLNAPLFVNAYVVTDGSIIGPIVQIALIALGTAIYAPFLRAMERGASTNEILELLRDVDGHFARIVDETYSLGHDRVSLPKTYYENLQRHNDAIRQIAPEGLELHYQPQVCRVSGEVVGSEALLRLRLPDGSLQPPGEFLRWISLVGLEPQLDLWAAEEACRQTTIWRSCGFLHETTINVSASTLNEPKYLRRIGETLAAADGRVHIEITEHAFTEQRPDTVEALTHLRQQGIRISLDDFGSGYSSLAYLHQLPIDVVKVDRSFVTALASERAERVLLGLLRLVDDLGLRVVVEGVETHAQLETIPTAASISIQGWLFARAMPGSELADFALSHAAAPS